MTYKTYQTVMATTPQQFDTAVTKLLNEGWQLYGDPYFADRHFCQALIK
jgi:hypothetical protein